MGLARDPQWLKLGHYHRALLGGYSSDAAGEAFFLSPQGSTSPDEELRATIQGLFASEERSYPALYGEPGTMEKQFPRCQFPARLLFLQRKLGVDPASLPPADCSRFERFRDGLQARSATVVFSSYFLNSPSSTFGHSLLRLSRSPVGTAEKDRHELLDRGINFAAEVTTDNAFVYGVSGLLGFFRGTYANMAYYYKVREYNDFEARDLWSYELNLSPAELEMLVAHLWELGSTYFKYYYFTSNCSYQILTAIEAAAPQYEITRALPIWIIPADTIKRLTALPGLVRSVSYRPSVRAQFFKRYALLSADEKRDFERLVSERSTAMPSAGLPLEARVRVSDAALDYMDYRYASDILKQEGPNSDWKQKLLVSRAEIPARSEKLAVQPGENDLPHEGHGSARAAASFGREKNVGNYTELGFRFALHDFLDPAPGYPENSAIEFLKLRMRYLTEVKRLEAEEILLFRVWSLFPLGRFQKGLSWRIQAGAQRFRDENCDRCFGGSLDGGAGYAVQPSDRFPLVFFGMLDGELSYAPGFYGSNARIGAGPSLGWVAGPDFLKFLAQGSYRREVFAISPNVLKASGELRWNPSVKWALGAKSEWVKPTWEYELSAYFYF